MERTAKIIVDYLGVSWRVTKERPMPHGFPVCFGLMEPSAGKGHPYIILTQELVDYLTATRARPGREIDLPIHRESIKRLRRRIGLSRASALSDWWVQRLTDLWTMSSKDFAARHGCHADQVDVARVRYFGNSRRPRRNPEWWEQSPAREILLSGRPYKEIALELEIHPKGVGRYVRRLRREAGGPK